MIGRLVYLVDDEEAIRRSLKLMLELAGHKVSAFASGTAFLDQADALAPGCVLLDIRMPDMDGLEVQQELIRRAIDLPVVMMTGHGDIATAAGALRAGADDFIEKPFERATILAAVEHACLRVADTDAHRARVRAAGEALGTLAEVERAAVEAFAQGLSNQVVAAALGLDVAAVERIRASVIAKLGVAGIADVLRIAYLARRIL